MTEISDSRSKIHGKSPGQRLDNGLITIICRDETNVEQVFEGSRLGRRNSARARFRSARRRARDVESRACAVYAPTFQAGKSPAAGKGLARSTSRACADQNRARARSLRERCATPQQARTPVRTCGSVRKSNRAGPSVAHARGAIARARSYRARFRSARASPTFEHVFDQPMVAVGRDSADGQVSPSPTAQHRACGEQPPRDAGVCPRCARDPGLLTSVRRSLVRTSLPVRQVRGVGGRVRGPGSAGRLVTRTSRKITVR